MIDYQEHEELQRERQETEGATFATVGAVYDDSVSLIFDGEGAPTEKHYKVNAFVVFKANDRVRIIKDSGTYVVEYPVGNPKTSFNANTAWKASRLGTVRQIKLMGDVEGTANFDGSANISINVSALRAAALKNAYSPISKNYDIKFYAQYANQLYYKVGSSGALTKLANG